MPREVVATDGCSVEGGEAPATVVPMGLHLSQIAEADERLANDPLALLVGMVLDQRVPERTSGPSRR